MDIPKKQPINNTPNPLTPELKIFGGESEEIQPQLQIKPDASIETLLAAWGEATSQLQETHETLRSEVVRLSSELEEKDVEIARNNRLADLGRMASHVAHEVRNNLVPVNLYLSLLRRNLSEDTAALNILSKVESGFNALDITVNDLLSFTAQRVPQCQDFLLGEMVEEVCNSLLPQIEAQQIDLEIDVPPHSLLNGDRTTLHRAVLNLILNALDMMPEGGELVISSHETETTLELEIADSGPGLNENQQQKMFDPFFTTKENGTGLGLAIVYQAAEAHGGTLLARNCPEGGAAFTLCFPRKTTTRGAAA